MMNVLEQIAMWGVGPWTCGCATVLAFSLIRALMIGYRDAGKLHFYAFNSYVVSPPKMLIWACVVVLIVWLTIAILISKRAISSINF